jgi:hypothetical protein
VKILCIYFGPVISCSYAPGYIQTFVSWTLFDFSNRKPSKNSTFISCSVLTDFCQYLYLPLYRFLFEFFWSWNFWGSCYSSICLICGGFELKSEAKRGWLYVMPTLMLLIDLCLVYMKEVFKCRDWRMMRWVEEWTKAQAWGCLCITPWNIQEVQASKLGDAPEAPLHHRQKSGHLSGHYIFIASCTMCFSWSVSCFSFQY